MDDDGIIGYASPSHERVLGYQPEEMLRQHTLMFVHPDDRASRLRTDQEFAIPRVPGCARGRLPEQPQGVVPMRFLP